MILLSLVLQIAIHQITFVSSAGTTNEDSKSISVALPSEVWNAFSTPILFYKFAKWTENARIEQVLEEYNHGLYGQISVSELRRILLEKLTKSEIDEWLTDPNWFSNGVTLQNGVEQLIASEAGITESDVIQIFHEIKGSEGLSTFIDTIKSIENWSLIGLEASKPIRDWKRALAEAAISTKIFPPLDGTAGYINVEVPAAISQSVGSKTYRLLDITDNTRPDDLLREYGGVLYNNHCQWSRMLALLKDNLSSVQFDAWMNHPVLKITQRIGFAGSIKSILSVLAEIKERAVAVNVFTWKMGDHGILEFLDLLSQFGNLYDYWSNATRSYLSLPGNRVSVMAAGYVSVSLPPSMLSMATYGNEFFFPPIPDTPWDLLQQTLSKGIFGQISILEFMSRLESMVNNGQMSRNEFNMWFLEPRINLILRYRMIESCEKIKSALGEMAIKTLTHKSIEDWVIKIFDWQRQSLQLQEFLKSLQRVDVSFWERAVESYNLEALSG